MGRHLSWRADRSYCQGKNRKGQPCGNTVPKHIRFCHHHRKDRHG